MNRSLTSLFAALEAALVVAIGIGICLAPLSILWGVQYGFGADWLNFWRAAVDTWLLGHGVDIVVNLDSSLAAALGVPAAEVTFPVTIAALGFALLTVLLAVRTGRRIAETRYRALGSIVALGTFGALSFAVTLSALNPTARPSLLQGTLLPTVVFGLGLAIGQLRARSGDVAPTHSRDWFSAWPPRARILVRHSLVAGASSVSGLFAVAAIVLAISLGAHFAQIVSLYEQLHGGPLGGLVLTLGQLALLPNLIIWTAAWLVGPGFAIGTGSTISPLATNVGPLPALPILGALPSGELPLGLLGILAPVVIAFLVAAVVGPTLLRRLEGEVTVASVLIAGLGSGVVAGVILGLLSWWSAGAAGPGRLVDVGPNPLVVALIATFEIALAGTLGLFASRRNRQRVPN
jgi:Family of unknown function (DUF6350)